MSGSIGGIGLADLYSGQAALTLLSGSSSSSASADLLLSYYQAQEGIANGGADSSATATGPVAPWNSSAPTPSVNQTVQNAVDGTPFINPNGATLSAPAGKSTEDYKNLFALYQGLNTLLDIAQTAQSMTASGASSAPPPISMGQLQSTFTSGMNQVQTFLGNDPFSEFNVTAGKVSTSEQSSVGVPNGAAQNYTTGVIGTGDEETPLAAFQGEVQFNITVANKYATTPTQVAVNLDDMGSRPRTIDNVVNYLNAQMKAAGVSTTFSVASLGNAVTTSTVGGQTTTTTGEPQWGLTVNGVASEAVSFSAAPTAGAVFVSEASGGLPPSTTTGAAATPVAEQLIKLQTTNSATAPNPSGDTTLPASGIFSKTLPTGVNSVTASATGSDGSVYLLADVSGAFSGAPVPGSQGAALLKYDAAGKLVYSKILGGQTDATGDALAVNSDGTVAIAGSTTTPATTALDGLTTAATTSAFVQVFDPTGAPSWSQTIPASDGTSSAAGVAFGADGSVYVSGTTTGSINDQVQQGASDEFIQGFKPDGTATFTSQFGSAGVNTAAGLAYDASTNALYTAGSENEQGVVRRFDLNGTLAPTLAATRSIGGVDGLTGIAVANGQVVVAGDVSAATLNVATVAKPYTGLADGFVASLSTDLTASSADTVNYLGTPGSTTTATGLAVSGGVAYVTGAIVGDPNSLSGENGAEGFVTGVSTTTGATTYSTTFTGKGGQAAPSAITVADGGASILDQLGLPDGAINAANSSLITANTAIQAGDALYVRTSPNGPQTAVTITATDTLTTLATKINGALGPYGAATVLAVGGNSELEITPANAGAYIELDSQPANPDPLLNPTKGAPVDVLGALGLSAGVVRTVKTINGLTDVSQLREYGLSLPTNLDLTTAAGAQAAVVALDAAIGTVQQAYQDLVSPPTMASEQAAQASNETGSVPAYLTAEIANYQAGLDRLTGGS